MIVDAILAMLIVAVPSAAPPASLRTVQYDSDCASLDDDQHAVNADWRALKNQYPFTTSFMISCVKSAKNDGDTANCMAATCGMASAGASGPNEGCVDFGLKLGHIATERDSLVKRRRLYPGCRAGVPDETND
jgi:hypothetical protein